MTQTQLTTARWEFLNSSFLSSESEQVISELLDKEIGYPAPNIGYVNSPVEPIAPLPDLKSNPKIALCIGHSRSNDSGAVAYNGVYEETYNNEVISLVKRKLSYHSEIINFYMGDSYGEAMHWLANHLKNNNFTHAFEYHFNSAGPTAKGYEYLFWHLSTKGIVMAKIHQKLHGEFFKGKYDRGIEPLGDDAHERGVLFTSLTHCPSIICEPFFGSNKEDAESYMTKSGKEKLSDFYVAAISESIKALQS